MSKITYAEFVEKLRADLPQLEDYAKQGLVGCGLVRQHKEAIRVWDASVICNRATPGELKICADEAANQFAAIHPYHRTWYLNLYRCEVPELEVGLVAGTIGYGALLVRNELVRLLAEAVG